MGQLPMDFAIVLHNGDTDISPLIDVLIEKNISVLNILTFSEWAEQGNIPEQNVLFVRHTGEVILAKDLVAKEAICREIECLTTLAFKPRIRKYRAKISHDL